LRVDDPLDLAPHLRRTVEMRGGTRPAEPNPIAVLKAGAPGARTSAAVTDVASSSESAPRYSTDSTDPATPSSRPRTTCSGRTPKVAPARSAVATGGPVVPAMTAPAAPCSSRSRFIGGVPMKRATKVFTGLS
jgi:hypothetical protein